MKRVVHFSPIPRHHVLGPNILFSTLFSNTVKDYKLYATFMQLLHVSVPKCSFKITSDTKQCQYRYFNLGSTMLRVRIIKRY